MYFDMGFGILVEVAALIFSSLPPSHHLRSVSLGEWHIFLQRFCRAKNTSRLQGVGGDRLDAHMGFHSVVVRSSVFKHLWSSVILMHMFHPFFLYGDDWLFQCFQYCVSQALSKSIFVQLRKPPLPKAGNMKVGQRIRQEGSHSTWLQCVAHER